MRLCFGVLSGVLLLVFLGCTSFLNVPCGDLSQWAGKRVTVTGCLKFTCPSFLGVHIPEDCLPYLEDESGIANLEFPEAQASLREALNAYYERSWEECILFSASGRVKVYSCDTPECSPWVVLEVETMENLSPGR